MQLIEQTGIIENSVWMRGTLADALLDLNAAILWERQLGSFTLRCVDWVRTWGRA